MSVGQTISRSFQRSKVFGWNLIVDIDSNCVYYYDPNGVDMYKIQLSASSIVQLKNLIAQIQAFMNSTDTWTGTVLEHWLVRNVTNPAQEVQQWVKQES